MVGGFNSLSQLSFLETNFNIRPNFLVAECQIDFSIREIGSIFAALKQLR